ncbi:MAG: UDP-galactopyranose mutase [Bacteroidales bacterium]
MKEYDYLIVGSGPFGAVFAHEATKKGKRCLVVDKRSHLGGNIYCENRNGINIHSYGAHIFHTSDKTVWNYVNQFAEFNNYINSPLAIFEDELYNLPFNMNTFYQLWKVKTPEEAKQKIEDQIAHLNIETPKNLEEQALKLVGTDIYQKLIKGYTEKQWGMSCVDLPPFIIRRLPVRFTYNNNYFNDIYQGIPKGGYNVIIDKLLDGVECLLDTDFLANREELSAKVNKIVFTGSIDEFFDSCYGSLEYRSLLFEQTELDIPNFQGNAVVNYTESSVPFTRIVEHKHFEFGVQESTIITHEYSVDWKPGMDRYYPINEEKNNALYRKYQKLADTVPNVLFGGRLAEYKYYDMHQVIASALSAVKKEFEECQK